MLKQLHHWLGLGISAWVVLASVSGALLLWKDDYTVWRYPSLAISSELIAPDPQRVAQLFEQASPSIRVLGMPTRSMPAYHAYFANGEQALLDPNTGALIAKWSKWDALPALLFDFHAHLLAGDVGHTVVGVFGLALLVNLVVGFVLWFKRRKIFRLRRAWPRDLSRQQLMRGHAGQGGLLAAALIVVVFSGVSMVFYEPVQWALDSSLGRLGPVRPAKMPVSNLDMEINWADSVETAVETFDQGVLRFVYRPATANEPIVTRLRNVGELHPNGRSYAVIHPANGRLIQKIDATQVGLGPAVFDALYPIHSGKTAWPGFRLLLSVVSLSLVFIGVSGAWLFISRRRRSH